MEQPTIKIEFKGMRNFDTLDQAMAYKEELGDRYRATQKCVYPAVYELNLPEVVFYTVYFKED